MSTVIQTMLVVALTATAQPSPFAGQVLSKTSPATERADDFDDALSRAQATGKDIVVLQRGSDWNACSESIYQNVWRNDAFVKALGDGFVLVSIDVPEVVGGRAVYGRCTAEKCGLVGYSETPIGGSAPLRLEKQCGHGAVPPPSEVIGVTSEAGVVYVRRNDGAWLVEDVKKTNPAVDTLVLRLRPANAGQVLRLDFPLDESLPNRGPGRAGNAVVSEVEVTQEGAPLKTEFAWGSVNLGNNFGPWTAVDGISEKRDHGWNLHGGQRQPRTLFVSLKKAVVANQEVTVKLVCTSQWNHHVPAVVRAAIVADLQTLADVQAVAAAQQRQHRNRKFTWADWGKIPRLAFFDAAGRPVAADTSLRIGVTPKSLADLVHAMRGKRENRDALWAKAEQAKGPARAELLRQSLDTLDVGRDPGFGRTNGWGGGANGPFEFVHKAMRDADPKDESGAIRWLGFGLGAWGAVAWAPDNQWWKKLERKPAPTDADWAAAEACIDRELADPRNKILQNEHVQHVMLARYDLYRRKLANNHVHPKLLDIQKQIAQYDPTTFWGLGAVGYIGMYRRSDQPFVCYGWDGNHQLKAGSNAWLLADAWQQVDHAGPYRFVLRYRSGKDSLKIRRIALMDGANVVAEGRPTAGQDVIGPNTRLVEAKFECRSWRENVRYAIRIEYDAEAGKLDNVGDFEIEPLLADD